MIKAIIFDFDLTLLDSREFGDKVGEFLEKEHGISFKGLTKDEIYGSTHEGLMKRVAELNDNKMHWEELSKIDGEAMEKHYADGEIKEIKFLKSLNERGILLGIISGNTVRTINNVLKNEKNNAKFAFVLCPENEHANKTKADLLKEAMGLFNINNKECMYIGDHPNDILAAKRAEVIAVGITTGFHDSEKLKVYGPDVIISELKELDKFL